MKNDQNHLTMISDTDFYRIQIQAPDTLGKALRLVDLQDGDRGFIYPAQLPYWGGDHFSADRYICVYPCFADGGSMQMRVWKLAGKLYCMPWPALLDHPLEKTVRPPIYSTKLLIDRALLPVVTPEVAEDQLVDA